MMILLCSENSLGINDFITMIAVASTAIATVVLAIYTKGIIASNQAMIDEQKRSRDAQDQALRRDRDLQIIHYLYQEFKDELEYLKYLAAEGPAAITVFARDLRNVRNQNNGNPDNVIYNNPFFRNMEGFMFGLQILLRKIRTSSLAKDDRIAYIQKVANLYNAWLSEHVSVAIWATAESKQKDWSTRIQSIHDEIHTGL